MSYAQHKPADIQAREDAAKNYVVELFDPGTESWVVIENCPGLTSAINVFRTQVLNSEQQYRLTTPKYSE